MLVAKNVLSLMIELGLVILCKGLWLSFDRTVPTDPCLFWLVKVIQSMVSP